MMLLYSLLSCIFLFLERVNKFLLLSYLLQHCFERMRLPDQIAPPSYWTIMHFINHLKKRGITNNIRSILLYFSFGFLFLIFFTLKMFYVTNVNVVNYLILFWFFHKKLLLIMLNVIHYIFIFISICFSRISLWLLILSHLINTLKELRIISWRPKKHVFSIVVCSLWIKYLQRARTEREW